MNGGEGSVTRLGADILIPDLDVATDEGEVDDCDDDDDDHDYDVRDDSRPSYRDARMK